MVTQICCACMKENGSFRRKKNRFVTALDLIKFLKKRLLLMCVPFSELPSKLSTMAISLIWELAALYQYCNPCELNSNQHQTPQKTIA